MYLFGINGLRKQKFFILLPENIELNDLKYFEANQLKKRPNFLFWPRKGQTWQLWPADPDTGHLSAIFPLFCFYIDTWRVIYAECIE